jgi:hypothetical protein
MFWHYSGIIAIHRPGEPPDEATVINHTFELPDRNVAIIRSFVQQNRELILSYKYQPTEGNAPWGISGHQQLMIQLNQMQPPETYWIDISDRQTKALLVTYRQELINNIDLYL